MTLEEAQIAKIDLSLSKLGLQPGMTLLDIGCGWGAAMRRAIERYDVNVIGLTLSKNQAAHAQKMFDRTRQPALQAGAARGLGALSASRSTESCRSARSSIRLRPLHRFFERTYELLPADGTMLLHTITKLSEQEMIESGLPMTMKIVEFGDFMQTEIFPGGAPADHRYGEGVLGEGRFQAEPSPVAAAALREDPRHVGRGPRGTQSEAIEIQSEEVYERYMKYLTGCADLFRNGYIDVNQFTLRK